MLDLLTNTEFLSKDENEDHFLIKEKFSCGAPVTQHEGLNGSHDLNRVKRTKKPKKWYFYRKFFVFQNIAVLHQAGV